MPLYLLFGINENLILEFLKSLLAVGCGIDKVNGGKTNVLNKKIDSW